MCDAAEQSDATTQWGNPLWRTLLWNTLVRETAQRREGTKRGERVTGDTRRLPGRETLRRVPAHGDRLAALAESRETARTPWSAARCNKLAGQAAE